MHKPPHSVNDFVVLPLSLPTTNFNSEPATHYLYLKPHDPKIPDEDTPRSLFVVNIPVSTTTGALKDLLTSTLDGGRVEKVYFSEDAATTKGAAGKNPSRSRKRKRMTAEEIEVELEARSSLPEVWDGEVHRSGASAVVVFVDRASLDLTLKAARRAARRGTPLAWDGAGDDKAKDASESTPPRTARGLHRYESHKSQQYPPRKDLLRAVNAYMTAYSAREAALSRESARRRAEPDDDGFVTVTRGSKGVARMDEAKDAAERVAKKEGARREGMGDFYRFQNRERRKDAQEAVRRRFEEDRKVVEEMRKRRKGV